MTLLPSPRSHLPRLTRIALLVAAGDLLTKEVALLLVSGSGVATSSLLRFAVVHNDKAAFGFSVGPYTWELNLALTLGAIALIVPVSRDLSAIDRHAPTALGLILGGALGNFVSLILSPNGVVDFIGIQMRGGGELFLNFADVAAYVGLALLLRTGALIVRRLHLLGPAGKPGTPAKHAGRRAVVFTDVEVPRPRFTDGIVPLAAAAVEPATSGSARPDAVVPIALIRTVDSRHARAVPLERARDDARMEPPHVRPMSHRPESR